MNLHTSINNLEISIWIFFCRGVAIVVCVWEGKLFGFRILSWKAFLSSIEPLLSAFHLISENDEQGRSIGYHIP